MADKHRREKPTRLTPIENDTGTLEQATSASAASLSPDIAIDQEHDHEMNVKDPPQDSRPSYITNGALDWMLIFVFAIFAFYVSDVLLDENEVFAPYRAEHSYTVSFENSQNITNSMEVLVRDPIHNKGFAENAAIDGFMLGVINVGLPFLYHSIFLLFLYYMLKWNLMLVYWELISLFYGFLTAEALTFWITKAMKIWFSYPRPDFWARCVFEYTNDVSDYTCNYIDDDDSADLPDEADFVKAFKSFPSGHSSYVFTSSMFLCLWTFSKLKHNTIRPKIIIPANLVFENLDMKLPIYLTVLFSLIGCIFVAISRIDDRRHFPTDLIAGAMLGMINAIFGFNAFFDLNHPYSKRVRRYLDKKYINDDPRQDDETDPEESNEADSDT